MILIYVTCFSCRFFFCCSINLFFDWFPEVANQLPTYATASRASAKCTKSQTVREPCVYCVITPKSRFLSGWVYYLVHYIGNRKSLFSVGHRKHRWLLFWRRRKMPNFIKFRTCFCEFSICFEINRSRLSFINQIYLTYYYFSINVFLLFFGYIWNRFWLKY